MEQKLCIGHRHRILFLMGLDRLILFFIFFLLPPYVEFFKLNLFSEIITVLILDHVDYFLDILLIY